MPVKALCIVPLKAVSSEFQSIRVSKVPHLIESPEPVQLSLENVSRAQPPRTLNLATSFLDAGSIPVKKMNSMESIGMCSLDADSTTHSEGSFSPSNDQHAIVENNYTSSAYTLKSTSLILSNGGLSPVPKLGNPELRIEQFVGDVPDRAALNPDKEERTPDKQATYLKDHIESAGDADHAHKPSYLGISCAISGYSGYSPYCHSRDNSPARINTVTPPKFSIALSKSPNVDPTVNESSPIILNGKSRTTSGSYICNKHFGTSTTTTTTTTTLSNAKSESHSFVSSQNITLRPNSKIRENFHYNGLNGHHPVDGSDREKEVKLFEDMVWNSRSSRDDLTGLPAIGSLSMNESPKSLVEQRIESLYGQPASNVVQGGNLRVSRPKCRTPMDPNLAKRSPSCPPQAFVSSSPLSCVSPSHGEIEIDAKESAASSNSNEIGDGHSFIVKIVDATACIRKQIKEVEVDSKLPGVPEEALGKLLSAAGKANLLIEQKFAQFRELCEKNIAPDPSEPFPTTNGDLAGFWDMVLLQVDNVNETFSSLRKLKARDWKEETVPYARSKSQIKIQPKRNIRASKSSPTTPEHGAKASELAKAREEQRKKLMEAKKRGRQQKPTDADVAIFVPDPTSK